MAEEEKPKIIWIGGYPFINGVKAPAEIKSDDPTEQRLDDVQWEQEQKAKGITGWRLFQAFLRYLDGEQ